MNITVNGSPRECIVERTVADLVSSSNLGLDAVVVERNNIILRPAVFAETLLAEGDVIEIVHMVGGG